jgi:hypothetical protein
MDRVKTYGPLVIIVLMASAALYVWYNAESIARRYVPAPEPEVRIETRTVTLPGPIVYFDKEAAADEDLVPDTVLYDPDKEITAYTKIPEHKGDTTVVAVIDKGTGVTTLDMRQERPRLFELESIKTVGIRCDVTTSCNELEVYGSWEFLRIGAIHLEAYGEISAEDAFIGFGLEYKW